MRRSSAVIVIAACLAACGTPSRAVAPLRSGEAAAAASAPFAWAFDPDASAAEAAAPTLGEARFRAPAPGGVTFSDPLPLDLRWRAAWPAGHRLLLDGTDVTARVRRGALRGQWIAMLPGLAPGDHRLTVVAADGRPLGEAAFAHATTPVRDRLVALADATVRRFEPTKMGWDWGEGLLLYALARLDAHLGEPRYRPFLVAYYDHWLAKGLPTIDWSDKCAPALAAHELWRATGDVRYKAICDRVATYLATAKPTRDGGLNHLGTWWASHVYPQSMWVDSLMMYGVFAARFARSTNDADLARFAGRQPLAFARVLQDPGDKLWKHAWLTTLRRPIPDSRTYWLRGNGWALASAPEILAQLPADDPQRAALVEIYRETAGAVLRHQDEGGLWHTVINRPEATYLETSGTSLVAYGLMRGAAEGHLPAAWAAPGKRAFLAVLDRLRATPEGPSMPEISHNTMPYSFLGYKLVPQRDDLAFGLAALLLAGLAHEGERQP